MKDYSLRDEKSKLIHATALSLHKHITELFENGYDQGYEDGKKESCDCKDNMDAEYNRGLNEAWEFIQKLLKDACDGGYTVSLLQNALGYCNISDIVRHYDISEAIAKIKEYEEKQKQDIIQVGDEVVLNCNASYENEKAIILACDESSYPYNVLMSNGDTEWVKENSIERKTNRHFPQIAEVLAEMRGDSE